MRRLLLVAILGAVCLIPARAGAIPFQAGGQIAGAEVERVGEMQVNEFLYEFGLYLGGIEAARIAAEQAAAQAAAAEAQLAAQRAAQARTAPSPVQSGGGGGGCFDGPIPAYIVDRESGGNPSAVNPSSGAYGCFQIMPYVWTAHCADLDRGVGGQIECANRISNGGTNLRPWAL